jgi:hypothetical protein
MLKADCEKADVQCERIRVILKAERLTLNAECERPPQSLIAPIRSN